MEFTMELLAPAEQTWVPAEEFQPGDSLKSLNGLRQITNRQLERTTERVYNIEVDGDHVYRVGHSGLLVHNYSIPSPDELIRKAKTYREENNMQNGRRNLGGIIYIRNKDCKVLRYTTSFPESFVISNSSGHTEDQINQHLTADPAIGNIPGSIQVLLLFTERSPCRRCSNTHIPEIERKNGGSIQGVLESFVEYGEGSNQELAIFYGFVESDQK
tara:strand:+ start:1248 stop:1892 length:645 start_codon:yes stop_codon:yes gene_type:complete